MQREIASKFEQVVQKARIEHGVTLDGFKATFSSRGKRRIVSFRRENGKTVAVFNAKWLTDANREGLLNNTIYHIVAQITASEKKMGFKPGTWDLGNLAKGMGATHMKSIEGLTTPSTCKRVAKARNWIYKDTNGQTRSVTTRLHNRMQREGVTYRYKDTGASISRATFLGSV